ncbi:MAG: hypothetical protein ACPGVU_13530 [Limisphaerales bacterium]
MYFYDFGLGWFFQHVTQITGMLANLLGFAVFGPIFRITKDSAYVMLAIASVLQLVIAA